MSDQPMTPVWCGLCRAWVPAEREPHVGPHPNPDLHLTTNPHYAADYPTPASDDKRTSEAATADGSAHETAHDGDRSPMGARD